MINLCAQCKGIKILPPPPQQILQQNVREKVIVPYADKDLKMS